MKRINVEIEEELHAKLKILAVRKGMPLKFLIPELLKTGLEQNNEKKGHN